MDPLSVTASILAVLAAASQSSKFLYNVFRNVRGGSAELNHYCALLNGLSHTFSSLHHLQSTAAVSSLLSPDFSNHLQRCLEDLNHACSSLQRSELMLKQNAFKRNWARIKWCILSEDHLQKFFVRLQAYHVQFSLELQCVQLYASPLIPFQIREVSTPEQLMWHRQIQSSNIETKSPEKLLNAGDATTCSPGLTSNVLEPDRHMALEARAQSGSTIADELRALERDIAYFSSKESNFSNSWITFLFRSLLFTVEIRARAKYKQLYLPKDSIPSNTAFTSSGNTTAFRILLRISRLRRWSFEIPFCSNTSLIFPFSINFEWKSTHVVGWSSPVMEAARTGDILGMESLFQAGKAFYSDVLTDGTTLLHIATSNGHIEMVRYLISRGTNVDTCDDDGETPLHIACNQAKDYELARLLLDSGADLGNVNYAGRTALHNMNNDVVRQVLLKSDWPLDLYAQDHDGKTILHYLARSKRTTVAEMQRLVKGCIPSLFIRDHDGRSTMHFAAMRGNTLLLSYILAIYTKHNNTSTIERSNDGLMECAAYSRRRETLGVVFAYTAPNPVQTDWVGKSFRHYQWKQNNKAGVQKILDRGELQLLAEADHQGGKDKCSQADLLHHGKHSAPTVETIGASNYSRLFLFFLICVLVTLTRCPTYLVSTSLAV